MNKAKLMVTSLKTQALAIFMYTAVSFSVFLGTPSIASAATYTCTGTGADTPATRTYVVFDYSAKTCAVTDAGFSNDTSDINFLTDVAGGNEQLGLGVGFGVILTSHDTASIDGTTYANGVSASKNVNTNGANTASGTYTISGTAYTMTVSFTVAGGGTSYDITAAQVTTPDPVSASPAVNAGSSSRALIVHVTKTQVRQTTQNIRKHLDMTTANRVAPQGGLVAGADTVSISSRGTVIERNWGETRSLTTGTYRSYGTNEMREVAKLLMSGVSFDSARGDLLTTMLGVDRRLNQAQTVPNNIPEQTRPSVPHTPLDLNVWVYSSYSNVSNTRNTTNDDSRYNGDIMTVSGGMDYRFSPAALGGIALSYSSTQLTTDFNDGTYVESAYTIAPYALWELTDKVNASVNVGYSYSPIDQTQSRSTTIVTSDTTARTMFGSVALSAKHYFGDVRVGSSMDYTRSHRLINAFTDTDGVNTTQA
ncbi:MAG: autotransporter outer membrane beta-barrel domain-containing protein, partial [Magnetovibrio sp.]|nr:autotransporter outer membrane beta-barrel domain-containing protein [Magnetovibrio sp.]